MTPLHFHMAFNLSSCTTDPREIPFLFLSCTSSLNSLQLARPSAALSSGFYIVVIIVVLFNSPFTLILQASWFRVTLY